MVLWVGRVNKDIVKEKKDEFVQVLTKNIVNHVHELDKGVDYTKRHHQKFVEPPPCLKHSFDEYLLELPSFANTL